MHFSRVRSAVGARLSAVVVCAALVAGLSACDGGGGASPTAPAAEARTPIGGTLCDVLPTDLLADALGFEAYSYGYSHHPTDPSWSAYNGRPGYFYMCLILSNQRTYSSLDIYYDRGTSMPHQVEFENAGPVEFDQVPEIFPNAEPVDIDGQDGRGWAWTINNAAYIFWLYPDGQSLYLSLRRSRGARVSPEQQQGLHAVAAAVIANVPPVAASSPSVHTVHPSPTP